MSLVVWFTGLSGSGKSTLCQAIERRLEASGLSVAVLDGDEVRKTLSRDLGFSYPDRVENLNRISQAARHLSRRNTVVLVAAISPYEHVRRSIRTQHEQFLEVFVNAPLPVCERRDAKGLYRKARAGLIPNFTGLTSPYQPPCQPDLECRTDRETVEGSCRRVLDHLRPLLFKDSRPDASLPQGALR